MIGQLIPHRPPMLLIDRIDELVPDVRGVATKQVTETLANTLVIDALGQIGIAVLRASVTPNGAGSPGSLAIGRDDRSAVWYLASLEDIETGRPASPGETLRLEASVQRIFKTTARLVLRASVPNGRDVVKGTMVLSNATTRAEP